MALVAAMAPCDLLLGQEGASIVVAAADEATSDLCFGVAPEFVELHDDHGRPCPDLPGQARRPGPWCQLLSHSGCGQAAGGLDFSLAILDGWSAWTARCTRWWWAPAAQRPASVAIGIGTPPRTRLSRCDYDPRYVQDHPDDPSTVWQEHSAAGEDHPSGLSALLDAGQPEPERFLAEDRAGRLPAARMREAAFRRARLCQLVDELEGAWLPPGTWAACARCDPLDSRPRARRAVPGRQPRATHRRGGRARRSAPPRRAAGVAGEAPRARTTGGCPSSRWRTPSGQPAAAGPRDRLRPVPLDPQHASTGRRRAAGDEFPQTPARMSPAAALPRGRGEDRQLTHSGDTALARHVANCVVREDARGTQVANGFGIPPPRSASAVAAIMALAAASHLEPAVERGVPPMTLLAPQSDTDNDLLAATARRAGRRPARDRPPRLLRRPAPAAVPRPRSSARRSAGCSRPSPAGATGRRRAAPAAAGDRVPVR